MKIDLLTHGNPLAYLDNQTVCNIEKRRYFKISSANRLGRIAAWGIDVAITGVLATIASQALGNNFQDTFFGPMLTYLICGFLYGTLMECSAWQATVGKHLLRMKVVRTDGTSLSSWHSAWRNLLKATVLLSVGLSYMLGAIHPQGATAHDLLSSTRVIRNDSPPLVGAQWSDKRIWEWIPVIFFTGMSVVVVSILGVVSMAIVSMRGLVYEGYKQLAPYMAKVESASPDGRNYPVTVTENTHGIKDDDLLPGSGYKAHYLAGLGQFTLEVPNISGKLALGFFPAKSLYNEKTFAAWVCIGQASTQQTKILYSLLAPASCEMKPFQEKILTKQRQMEHAP